MIHRLSFALGNERCLREFQVVLVADLSVRRDKVFFFFSITIADLFQSYFLNFYQTLQLLYGRVCYAFPVLKIAIN